MHHHWSLPTSLDEDPTPIRSVRRRQQRPRVPCAGDCGGTATTRSKTGLCRACYLGASWARKTALTTQRRTIDRATLRDLARQAKANGGPVPVDPEVLRTLVTIAQETAS